MVSIVSGFQEHAVAQADGKHVDGWASWRLRLLRGFRRPWGPSERQRLVVVVAVVVAAFVAAASLPPLLLSLLLLVAIPGMARRFHKSAPPSHESFSSLVNLKRSRSPVRGAFSLESAESFIVARVGVLLGLCL